MKNLTKVKKMKVIRDGFYSGAAMWGITGRSEEMYFLDSYFDEQQDVYYDLLKSVSDRKITLAFENVAKNSGSVEAIFVPVKIYQATL